MKIFVFYYMFVAHRINTINELKKVSPEFGIEVDLRDFGNKIVLSHDPFQYGEDFIGFLGHFKHKFIILNIKSERIEYKVLEILKFYNITNYFFLDSSFPMIIDLIKNKEKKIAVRFSQYETIDTILNLRNLATWVWVDCFTRFPLNKKNYEVFKNNGFKICIVSPEL